MALLAASDDRFVPTHVGRSHWYGPQAVEWADGQTTEFPRGALEFYVKPITAPPMSEAVRQAFETQQCPILGAKCLKNRKSEPEQTIGSCIVGHQGLPLVICPIRLRSKEVFEEAVPLLSAYERGMDLVAIPEIGGGARGSIDYVLTAFKDERYVDHIGIEFQTLDTTGSVWASRNDYLTGSSPSAKYGINWRMNAKTILIQLHHKAPIFAEHGKKLLLVVQDAFLDKLRGDFNFEDYREANMEDVLHIHAYRLVYSRGKDDGSFRMELTDRISAGLEGIEKSLAAVEGGELPTLEEFSQRLVEKRARGVAIQLDELGRQPVITTEEALGADAGDEFSGTESPETGA
jgi:hypothetical protein